jgi:hypothetical protein
VIFDFTPKEGTGDKKLSTQEGTGTSETKSTEVTPENFKELTPEMHRDDTVVLDDSQHRELVTYVHAYLLRHNELPSPTSFKLKYGLDLTLQDLVERFNEPLQSRGLPQYELPVPKFEAPALPDLPDDKLTPAQLELKVETEKAQAIPRLPPVGVIAAHLISDVGDKRSKAAKLKSLDLTTADWEGFMLNPEFADFFHDLIDSKFRSYSTSAKVGLGKLIESGELNAIKYYHEFTGEFKPQQQEVVNLQMIIAQLMELLATFVSVDQLSQIADRMEGIIAGNGIKSNAIETITKEKLELERNV